MEFDTTTSVSDEQRRLAEAKKITVQPVHSGLQPDDLPDAEIATRHILEPAIPNVDSDIEQNVAPIRPSKSVLNGTKAVSARHRVALTLAGAAVLAVAVTSVLLTR